MKNIILLFSFLFLLSCSKNDNELSTEFSCLTTNSETNLSEIKDIRNLFSVSFPSHWKTNLYYDNSQTSIFTADTTKSLTKSILIDVTLIHESINFDDSFIGKITASVQKNELKNVVLKEISFLETPSFLQHSTGKKNNYSYEVLNVFSKVNSDNFLHTKIEIYGDSAVSERRCKAIDLINNIQLN